MLISRIGQPDFHAAEFANRHAAVHLARPASEDGFADYLATTLNAGAVRSEADGGRRPVDLSTESAQQVANEVASDARARPAVDERSESDSSPDRSRADQGQPGTDTGSEPGPVSRADAGEGSPAGSPPDADESSVPGDPDAARSGEDRPAGTAEGARRGLAAEIGGAADDAADLVTAEQTALNESAVSGASLQGTPGEMPVVELDVELDAGKLDGGRVTVSARSMPDEVSESARQFSAAQEARRASADLERSDDSDTRETRSRGERRIAVRDLRRELDGSGADRPGADGEAAARRDSGQSSQNALERMTSHMREGATPEASDGDADRPWGPTTNASARSLPDASRSSELASRLHRTVQEQLTGEIVRSARLIVRSADRGEIRLHLRPENLGSVRITLHMQDGHIAGRIIVDNQTVREVFEQNLASLQRAFQESGLEASGVQISLADSGGRDGRDGEASGRTGPRVVADRFGQLVPDLGWIDEQHDLVDLVV